MCDSHFLPYSIKSKAVLVQLFHFLIQDDTIKGITMKQLNERQLKILDFIKVNKSASNRQIVEHLGDISRVTVVRDLEELLEKDLIKKEGGGRNVCYLDNVENKLLRYIDVEKYFEVSLDERNILFGHFNFDIFKNLKDLFSKREIEGLEKLNGGYRERIKRLSDTILKKEFERLSIELSWKSSKIEGNTYSLLDAEILIKENKEAAGHKKEEATMILNHKKALDYILGNKKEFKKIDLRKIENIQKFIVEGMGIKQGIREAPVGIVGTGYRPLDNKHQIEEAVEKVIKLVESLGNPFEKALVLISMISYIQPFEDGNKRTSRLLGDAMLLAYDVCPLSFRSVDEVDYKKAMILFYEQNNLRFFKELFVQQFKFAVGNYFLL